MRTSRSRRCAGALLAVVATTLLLPVVALARAPEPPAARHACSCPVKMACCEAGLCDGEDDSSPRSGPTWTGCREESSGREAVPAPSTALDSAILSASGATVSGAGTTVPFVAPAAVEEAGPAPATPPPRRFTRSR